MDQIPDQFKITLQTAGNNMDQDLDLDLEKDQEMDNRVGSLIGYPQRFYD